MTRGFVTHGSALLLTVVLGACAGKSLTTSGSAMSPTPAPDVFACVRKEIKAIGFSQDSYDEDELRVTARKYDENVRRPDVQFRRLVHRLAFEVHPGGGDTVTVISAEAKTFAELATHRGPTEQQERTAEAAKEAARTVLERCTTKR